VLYWQGTLEPLPSLSLHTLLETQSFTVLLVLFQERMPVPSLEMPYQQVKLLVGGCDGDAEPHGGSIQDTS
jgi:hypothetical protein